MKFCGNSSLPGLEWLKRGAAFLPCFPQLARYIVTDLNAAIAFYCEKLGFTEVTHPAPGFATGRSGGMPCMWGATLRAQDLYMECVEVFHLF